MSQLRCGLGDEAEESLEAVQSEEHQPAGENLPESAEWKDGGWLGQTGDQCGGQRSTCTLTNTHTDSHMLKTQRVGFEGLEGCGFYLKMLLINYNQICLLSNELSQNV